MKPFILSILILICFGQQALGQVKHNFQMDPEKTNCHELPQKFESVDSALMAIKKATFRLQENINISKYRTPNKADFFSCDGKQGYLIVEENDTSTKVYLNVPEEIWREFTSTKDPFNYYEKEIDTLPSVVDN